MTSGSDQRAARYDEIADWYRSWSAGWSSGFLCDPETGLVPERLDEERWLDVACGTGRTARELARRGASVVGIDLAAKMLDQPRTDDAAALGIDYRTADVTTPVDWWDGVSFDGAVCEMAVMDIDDLYGMVRAVARVLRPGGRLLVSLVHPCCPRTEAGLSSWPPGAGYHAEGFWTSPAHNPEGVRVRVGSNHRTLSTYLNAFIDGGFVIERVREPAAEVSLYLMLSLRRP